MERLELEDTLKSALDQGKLCLLVGPSKTGKTVLHTKVLEELGKRRVLVRCHIGMTPNELWSAALEHLRVSFVTTRAESDTATNSTTHKDG